MGLFSRRPPRHRQLLYFVLGIVIFNIAVSYYYHNLSQKQHRLENSKEGYIGGFYLYDTSEDTEMTKEKDENLNAKRNSVDAMPISVDVKKYKVRRSNQHALDSASLHPIRL